MALPMPWLAPVTMATRPWSLRVMIGGCCRALRSLGSPQHLGEVLFRNGAFFDHAPEGLGDVDGSGAQAGHGAAIENQIHAAVHDAEYLDAAGEGGLAGKIGAGGDQG